MKICIMDDEPEITEIILSTLSEEGHEVFGFFNQQSLLAYLSISNTDVVITEIQLPLENVREYISNIQKLASGVKIIISSGNPDCMHELRMIRSKSIRFIAKPYSQKELIKILEQFANETVIRQA